MNNPDDIAPGNNPDGLTNAQVGEGYRLLTAEEIRARNAADFCDFDDRLSLWSAEGAAWESRCFGTNDSLTYRVPISAVSFMPEPEIDKDALLEEMAGVITAYHHATIEVINAANSGDLSGITRAAEHISGVAGRGANVLASYKEAAQ